MNEFESGVTEEMARALAAAAAADTDVIIVDGEIYEISEDEARADFGEYMMHNGQPGDTFADWVKETCLPFMPDDNYVVMRDEEADAAALEYVRESVQYFSASFLAGFLDLDVEIIEAIQGVNEEKARVALLALLGDRLDDFVDEAISCDGRGHFLASYDGNEFEFNARDYGHGYFFVYRT